MKGKTIFLITFSVMLSLLLSSAGVSAQFPHPPEPTPRPEGDIRFSDRDNPGVLDEEPSFSHRPSTAPKPLSPSVTLGSPGLSFRYVQTFGVTEVGYLTDGQHVNAPSGLYMDGSNNLYVVEDHGHRLLRFNSAGVNTLSVGTASLCVEQNNPTGFCFPQDVALDGSGNIWVASGHRVVQLSSAGAYLQQLPVPNANGGWSSGDDTTHFRSAAGIAFDNTNGRMFVADRRNHRVQVYTFSGVNPVYSATIGVTGVSGSDNNHFNSPRRLAVDSSGRLYVVDSNNGRIQRCTFSGAWSCAAFGNVTGSFYPRGVSVDNSSNVYIYDSDGGRVVKCTSGGSCSDLVTGMLYSQDVAVDSLGNIYAGAYGHAEIRKYDSSGGFIGGFVGTWHVGYLPDATHIFSPWGIAVAPDGSFYVTEDDGYRFLKFNSSGVQQWAKGSPGSWGDASDGEFSNLQGKPAIASNGNIYVPDSGNNSVQIFQPDGAYVSTFGSYGTGNDQFASPGGIAFSPINSDIYVADRDNHRVQVYDGSFSYKMTLGETGVSGSDATHFNWPTDVAVASNGAIYVADFDNSRVQKCALSGGGYTCATFAGETGVWDWGFDYFDGPAGVAVDSVGRVYVADEWNNRVQVFNSNGAYLTTIGGSWGSNTGQLRDPRGIALDSYGNVYVTDWGNNRVQKFAPGVPGWWQSNINGFGDPGHYVNALAVFSNRMYAGLWNHPNKATVWRTSDGSSWYDFTPSWTISNTIVFDEKAFKSHLYFGTANNWGGELWRTNGTTWEQVGAGGFGDVNNDGIRALAVFSDTLYAATFNYDTGTEVWKSVTGNLGSWSQDNTDGFGKNQTGQDMVMEPFGDHLYLGLWRGLDANSSKGELWRTDGLSWTKVFTDGLAANNTSISAMAEFNGDFYIGLRNVTTGGELWKSSDGLNWTQVFNNGMGNPNNQRPYGLIVYDNKLYLLFTNLVTGSQVWRTANGTAWEPVNLDGWGDSNTGISDYYDKGAAVFNDDLYIGTAGGVSGGKIWKLLNNRIFLPLVVR